jgi:hypothetical protein
MIVISIKILAQELAKPGLLPGGCLIIRFYWTCDAVEG